MRADIMKKMKDAISNVLETMFFLPTEILDRDISLQQWLAHEKALLGSQIHFHGSLSGSTYLLVPEEVAGEITANFLGLGEGEVTEEQKKDTVKEAINMIGGQLLSLLDSEGAFRLGIPELMDEGELGVERLGELEGDVLFIETESNHLAAGIRVG